jgi:hypothetical protein
MLLVQEAPALQHLTLVAELVGGRRTTELDEGRVRPIAKTDQIRVDAATLGTVVACGDLWGSATREPAVAVRRVLASRHVG